MIVYPHVQQGSAEWHLMRAGRPTASMFSKIITPTGKLSVQSEEYIDFLIGAAFAPEFQEFGGTKWTDRGTELEPDARAAFEEMSGLQVEEVGFCTRDDNVVGCSPDGLIRGSDGQWTEGLEIKCKSPRVHVSYVRGGALPADVRVQVHGCLAVTGLPRWHFFSFFPGMQPLHVIVTRGEFTDKVSAALDEFLIRYGAARESLIPKLKLAA